MNGIDPRSEDEALSDDALLALVEALPPVAPRPELRARLLESLGTVDRFSPFLATLGELFDLPLAAMREVLGRIDDAAGFLTAMPGVRYQHFTPGPARAAAEAGLVLLEPGAVFPRHRHVGIERTFVLEGFMRDGDVVHAPGSLVEHPPGTSHDYAATDTRPLAIIVLHHGIELEDPSILSSSG